MAQKKSKLNPLSIVLTVLLIIGAIWFVSSFKDDIGAELALGNTIQNGYSFYYPNNFTSKPIPGRDLAYYAESGEFISVERNSEVKLPNGVNEAYCAAFAKVQSKPVTPEIKSEVLEVKVIDSNAKSEGCFYKTSFVSGTDDLIIESKALWSKETRDVLYLVNGTYSVKTAASVKETINDAIMQFSLM